MKLIDPNPPSSNRHSVEPYRTSYHEILLFDLNKLNFRMGHACFFEVRYWRVTMALQMECISLRAVVNVMITS